VATDKLKLVGKPDRTASQKSMEGRYAAAGRQVADSRDRVVVVQQVVVQQVVVQQVVVQQVVVQQVVVQQVVVQSAEA